MMLYPDCLFCSYVFVYNLLCIVGKAVYPSVHLLMYMMWLYAVNFILK